jgi:hypothetical protein
MRHPVALANKAIVAAERLSSTLASGFCDSSVAMVIRFERRNSFDQLRFCYVEVKFMSKETPKTDPRERTDWGSHKQTDKKGNPEKEQRNDDEKLDLEKWQESSTH